MTLIDAKQIVKPTFPPDEGASLARALLADNATDWDDLTVDLSALPASLLISAFFNAYLQTVHETKPALLAVARRTKWKLKFQFQTNNVLDWMTKFQPYTPA